MTITVRQTRRGGAVVRLTGAHARVLTGLLVELMGSEPVAAAPNPVPDRSDSETRALGADTAPDGSQRA